jgi:hypothetical protein
VAIVLRPEQRPWSPLGPKISAILPLEASRAAARRLFTRVTWVLLVSAAAAFVAALTGAGSAVLLLAAAALVAYAALVLAGEVRWIGSKASPVEGEVVLTRVDRAFARAVDEQYHR